MVLLKELRFKTSLTLPLNIFALEVFQMEKEDDSGKENFGDTQANQSPELQGF